MIPQYAEQLRKAVKAHPRYTLDYPETYRHGIDPVPEYEMVYTPGAGEAKNYVLDYFIPIAETEAEDMEPTKETSEMNNATNDKATYDKRVVIEDAPRPYHSCSSLASLTAALQQRGENITYTYLMGASARAFRLQFS